MVAEMMDVDNDELVRMVGGSVVETIVSHDIIGRLMMNAARQPGLADVFEQLLGFDGCEFYSEHWPNVSKHAASGRTHSHLNAQSP